MLVISPEYADISAEWLLFCRAALRRPGQCLTSASATSHRRWHSEPRCLHTCPSCSLGIIDLRDCNLDRLLSMLGRRGDKYAQVSCLLTSTKWMIGGKRPRTRSTETSKAACSCQVPLDVLMTGPRWLEPRRFGGWTDADRIKANGQLRRRPRPKP